MSFPNDFPSVANTPVVAAHNQPVPPALSLEPEKTDGGLAQGKFTDDHPLFHELAPEDSFEKGVYWADLPFAQRHKWVNTQSNAEAKREVKHVWSMFKEDPLSPIRAYSRRYVIGGFGLFTEGYTLFSIGNLTALYSAVWPTCWKTYKVCNSNTVAAVTYLQIIGIIIGQIAVGFEGDWIGRRFGLVQDALIMTLGLVMLTASWGTSLEGWVVCYGVSQLVYGIGVGGEYPMTSTTAMESKSVAGSQTDDKLHRGRNVVLAFLMQGWGQLFNQGLLIVLLLIFHGRGGPPYGTVSTQWTFRISFAIMAVMTLWLAYYRYYKKVYSSHALLRSKKNARVNQSGYDVHSLKLVFSHFSGRLVGTTMGWFCNDFLFYGNKLFASSFIKIISPDSADDVVTSWLWNLLNVGVEMLGYYLAALMIDHKFYGRKRMQSTGFLADAILFLIPAIWYNQLQTKTHVKGFQAIYFLSSFFQQFGPNCTTFLLAAEVFPISVRATAHGLSAASGKVGALVPAIVYNYVDSRARFWIVCWFGFAGWILTQIFIPDTTGLDLREQDRYWEYVREGRAKDYHGIAVHPRHLSWYERLILKRHLAYDIEWDRRERVKEMRLAWEAKQAMKIEENPGRNLDDDDDDDDEFSPKTMGYFNHEKKMARAKVANGDAANGEGPPYKSRLSELEQRE
ncbi:Pi-transporter A-1 [Tremella mesenterica]|uniref:Pi-transporter A-1 n=1 Tax=Tremella mesenterica TaxID=5217 RepID=A0A4Q1BHC5_TREME|nr:Pi-transporter A-1 [Tremella mesenterica]